MTGEDQPLPGICVFHVMFSVSLKEIGTSQLAATPCPVGPRNCGQNAGQSLDPLAGEGGSANSAGEMKIIDVNTQMSQLFNGIPSRPTNQAYTLPRNASVRAMAKLQAYQRGKRNYFGIFFKFVGGSPSKCAPGDSEGETKLVRCPFSHSFARANHEVFENQHTSAK